MGRETWASALAYHGKLFGEGQRAHHQREVARRSQEEVRIGLRS